MDSEEAATVAELAAATALEERAVAATEAATGEEETVEAWVVVQAVGWEAAEMVEVATEVAMEEEVMVEG